MDATFPHTHTGLPWENKKPEPQKRTSKLVATNNLRANSQKTTSPKMSPWTRAAMGSANKFSRVAIAILPESTIAGMTRTSLPKGIYTGHKAATHNCWAYVYTIQLHGAIGTCHLYQQKPASLHHSERQAGRVLNMDGTWVRGQERKNIIRQAERA